MEELIGQLKIAFANTFVFHIKAWGYHWNVEGSDFYEYHKLLELIYSEVQEAIDPTAENIRQLQSYAPFAMERIKQLSEVPEDLKIPPVEGMVQELLAANQVVIDSLQRVYDLAEANKQNALSNFMAERLSAHNKHAWFLRSSIKKR